MPKSPEPPTSPSPPSAKPRPGRPRQVDLDQRLETAVLALLRDRGPAAVTVEAVATQSGVAKTSIYRRYANRGELLTAALQNAIGVPQLSEEGTVRDKVRSSLQQAWRQMADILGSGGLAAIVGNSDPEFTELFRAALRPYDEALVARIREDMQAGLLRPDLDPDAVASLLLGAYVGELVRRGRVDPGWLDRSLEMIWTTLLAAPHPVAHAATHDGRGSQPHHCYGPGMKARPAASHSTPVERCHVPSHVPSGAALLALQLSEEARGITGLDVLRRSVDRAPPTQS